MHSQFIHDVAQGRGMKDADLKPLANGKVWTGSQALPLKMIDQIGDFRWQWTRLRNKSASRASPPS